MKHIFLTPTVVAMCAAVGAAEWGADYETALAQAEQQNKAVLADFTGSDWCGYCIKLRAEVLDTPAFAEWAENHFVLLEVDVPHNPNYDRKKLEKNRQLCTKYGIDGFPTVLVLDSKGRALGGLFGYEGDPITVQKILDNGLQVIRLLRAADTLEGEAKVHAMVEAWRMVPDELHDLNRELQAEICAIDHADLSGLKAAADADRRLQACIHAANAAPTDAVALEIVDAALFEAVPANKRQLLELKYRLMICSVETKEDVLAAAEVAYDIIDADLRIPLREKASRIKQMEGVFANPQTALNRSKMIRRKRPIR